MDILKHPLLKQIYETCLAIEDLPASEKETIAVTMCSKAGDMAEILVDERVKMLATLQKCCRAMAKWGGEEDGIPDIAYQAFVDAVGLLPDAMKKGCYNPDGKFTGKQTCSDCIDAACGDNTTDSIKNFAG